MAGKVKDNIPISIENRKIARILFKIRMGAPLAQPYQPSPPTIRLYKPEISTMFGAESEWQIFSQHCTRIDTEIDIARPQQKVFDYVTTPALWHTWHPATVEVREVPNRPLITGETMLELIAVAGRSEQARWTVIACLPPRSWEIATDTASGTARIAYTIVAIESGCRFHRTLEFRSKRWPWRLLDSTLTRSILVRQSARALRNLKTVLECGPAPRQSVSSPGRGKATSS
jgi:uncharacterized protein YndB with AHSA1/START domain